MTLIAHNVLPLMLYLYRRPAANLWQTLSHNVVLSKSRLEITSVGCLILFHYIGNIASNGIASQSSVYYWKDRDQNMTEDLAITGGRTHNFSSGSCATTGYPPPDYFAWWMLTFPVDIVYITTVKIYYRYNSKSYFSFVCFKLIFIIHSINQCETENILDIQCSRVLTCMFKCWTSINSPMHQTAWFN